MSNPRYANPAADALIDVKHPVLNHGFVALRDYMGGDRSIADAARVSYQDGTKTVNDDAGLIDHLIRNEHTSPLEQCILTFHLKLPIFVMRQLVRHRTARLNEISGRYSILPAEFYVPAAEQIMPQSTDNKQGRAGGPMEHADSEVDFFRAEGFNAFSAYQTRLHDGMARELARINLPLSSYTECIWQIDLHNLMHFMKLRLDHHAQYEIRVFAQAMYDITRAVAPLALNSFDNWIKDSVTLSGQEWVLVQQFLLQGNLLAFLETTEAHSYFRGNAKALQRFVHKLKTGEQQ